MNFLAPFFGIFTIACAAAVILSRNAVYAAFSLLLCLFGLSALYLCWQMPFLAIIQILIYAGAIVVLFVFVVMFMNLGTQNDEKMYPWPLVTLGVLSAWGLALLFLRGLTTSQVQSTQAGNTGLSLVQTAELLFTKYLWPFEILSVFLLALIVAIFVLARTGPEEC